MSIYYLVSEWTDRHGHPSEKVYRVHSDLSDARGDYAEVVHDLKANYARECRCQPDEWLCMADVTFCVVLGRVEAETLFDALSLDVTDSRAIGYAEYAYGDHEAGRTFVVNDWLEQVDYDAALKAMDGALLSEIASKHWRSAQEFFDDYCTVHRAYMGQNPEFNSRDYRWLN